MKFKIVEEFTYKGRKCVVVKIYQSDLRKVLKKHYPDKEPMKLAMKLHKDYHTGYIELKPGEIKESYDEYPHVREELTFMRTLNHIDKKFDDTVFLGFDLAHYWNMENPKTQTKEWAVKTCKEVVDDLNSNML